MKPLFRADWLEVVFLHLRVDAAELQPLVPLELDRFAGDAYVSLVAFTQSRLRPAAAGRWMEWLSAPLARHAFFNVRTYVRDRDVRGIYFLAEWIPNRLAVLLGPRMYGLPYRLGRLNYRNEAWRSEMTGRVRGMRGEASYRAAVESHSFSPAEPNTLDAFLLERYVAFTSRGDRLRRFDVDHAPWPQARVDAKLCDASLLPIQGELVAANYSPGVYDVGISAPQARGVYVSATNPQ